MIEAIAFISGIIAMAVVWFINDNSPDTSFYSKRVADDMKMIEMGGET